MSCIMLEKPHYQYIADSLYRLGVQFDRMMPFPRTKTEFGAFTAEERERKIITGVCDLQCMNSMAYQERYREDSIFQIDFVSNVGTLGGDLNPFQFLKALECVRYQCSDSSHFADSWQKKMLDTAIRECLEHIAHESAGYQSAKWGIESRLDICAAA